MTEKNQDFVESLDKRNAIKPVSSTTKRCTHASSDLPSLVVGFPGTGLVGSISANYIIETTGMHQIAAIDSEFVIPTVTFIGGMLRHPFRTYANEKGSLYVIVCDAPIMPEGVHGIMDTVVRWVMNRKIGEVIVLDGIPVKGFPSKDRKPVVLTSYGDKEEDSLSNATLMTGLSAGLLSSCLFNDVPCTAVMVPASSGAPDPEGSAILLNTISRMPNVPLKIDTDPLIKQGREIKRRLGEDMEKMRNMQEEQGRTSPYLNRSQMYG
jgi:uncharacterized protein